MRINYLKVIPIFAVEMLKIAPIIIKYGKVMWMEIRNMYDKKYIADLDKIVKESLGIKEEQ